MNIADLLRTDLHVPGIALVPGKIDGNRMGAGFNRTGEWRMDGHVQYMAETDIYRICPGRTIEADRSTVRDAVDIKFSHAQRVVHRCRIFRTIGKCRQGVDAR